jgi:probable HAF family extracellular repeat protein
MKTKIWGVVAAVALSSTEFFTTAFLSTSARAATFQGLGILSGDGYSEANGISANGTTVVGGYFDAFIWNASYGITSLGGFAGANETSATAANANGSVIVGYSGTVGTSPSYVDNIQAALWTKTGGAIGLGTLPGNTSSYAYGVSANGRVVVGYSNYSTSGESEQDEAFRWTKAGGMVGLGFLPGQVGGRSDATGVSANGRVVVGFAGTPGKDEAFRWTKAGGMVGLGYLPGGTFTVAEAVSGNGRVVVGYGDSYPTPTNQNIQAIRWVGGTMIDIGAFFAFATNYNGSVIVGKGDPGTPFGGDAVLWTAATGEESIQDLLMAEGVSTSGWTLFDATGISANGKIITGVGFDPSGNEEAWIVNLSATATPLPAALPLFATGLGGLSLLGRRRKPRNAAAVA